MSRLQMNRGSSTSGSAEVCTGPSRSSQRPSGDHQQGKQSTGITGITPPCIGTVANKNLPRDIEWSSLALFIHLEEKKEKQTNKRIKKEWWGLGEVWKANLCYHASSPTADHIHELVPMSWEAKSTCERWVERHGFDLKTELCAFSDVKELQPFLELNVILGFCAFPWAAFTRVLGHSHAPDQWG